MGLVFIYWEECNEISASSDSEVAFETSLSNGTSINHQKYFASLFELSIFKAEVGRFLGLQ